MKEKQHPPFPVARPVAHPKQQDVHWMHKVNATQYITATVNAKWNIGKKATSENANDWKPPPKPKRKHRCPRRKKKTIQTKRKLLAAELETTPGKSQHLHDCVVTIAWTTKTYRNPTLSVALFVRMNYCTCTPNYPLGCQYVVHMI